MNHERMADGAAAASWGLWIIAQSMEWMPVAQLLSFLAAIVASVAATCYYLKKRP